MCTAAELTALPFPVSIIKCCRDGKIMGQRSQEDMHVKYLMRGEKIIEFPGCQTLRDSVCTGRIKIKGSDYNASVRRSDWNGLDWYVLDQCTHDV